MDGRVYWKNKVLDNITLNAEICTCTYGQCSSLYTAIGPTPESNFVTSCSSAAPRDVPRPSSSDNLLSSTRLLISTIAAVGLLRELGKFCSSCVRAECRGLEPREIYDVSSPESERPTRTMMSE